MTMVRAGLILLATLAAFVAVVAGVGLMLPRDHVATRSARLPAGPDAVFAVIADVGVYAAWRTSLSAVEVSRRSTAARAGSKRAAGTASRWNRSSASRRAAW